MSLVPANSVFEWDHHDCIRSVNDHCLCLRYDNVTLSPLLLLTGAQAEWGLRYRIYLCLWSSLSLYHSHRPGPYWLSTYVTINAYVSPLTLLSMHMYRHCMCFRVSYVFVLSILFWFPQRTHYFPVSIYGTGSPVLGDHNTGILVFSLRFLCRLTAFMDFL